MGRVSRDARLLFVMLWPICDDHGRTRAASRMLASLLFPYDDDAPGLIDGWLDELEREGCIRRYTANGSTFLEVANWLIHQKIDKPSKPQFPEPPGSLANPREDSSLEGKGREGKGKEESIGASPDGDAPAGRADPIPYQAILDAYNGTLTNLAKARELTPKRRTLIRSAWQAVAQRRSLGFWQAYFAECQDDGFLNGTGPYGKGHENWRPDFDYLLRADVVTKTFERAMDRLERES
jgi:hypothetical protein